MDERTFFKSSLYFTAAITLAIWTLLLWLHYHGGVPSHHILANKDLPKISNWWGGLLLPLLTCILLYRIWQVNFRPVSNSTERSGLLLPVLYRFLFSLLFGILLSIFYTFGYEDIPRYMILALLVLALFIPIYKAECLLGFVIGMTFTFGAVLPTGIGVILASVGLILYVFVRPGILYIISKFKP